MTIDVDRLFSLLPAVIRRRDAEHGEPLKALVAVLAEQGAVVEGDLLRLSDNLFIETCDEWVVPYLGDLLGIQGLHDIAASGFSQRARVANTLSFRRRKGTATMLEQLALDTTGWRARVVEYFELLSTTQWLNHRRLEASQCADLRRSEELALLGSAFESTHHTADLRHISNGRGRYNLANIGIFLWRLQSYHWENSPARPAKTGVSAEKGRFYFSPLALDIPIFNRPQTETRIQVLADETQVPGRLRRRALYDELEAIRQSIADQELLTPKWFGQNPVLSLKYRLNPGSPWILVPPKELLICALIPPTPVIPEIWTRPPKAKTYIRSRDGASVSLPIQVAVDPELGRIAFPAGVVPSEVRVDYATGFPGDIGGGPYGRRDSISAFPLSVATWQAGVGHDLISDTAKQLYSTLAAAVTAWNLNPPGTIGILTLIDNSTYDEGPITIDIKKGSRLLIVSADWPEIGTNPARRVIGKIAPQGRRAHVVGDLTVNGDSAGELWMDGLLLEGQLVLSATGGEDLGKLSLFHTTLLPKSGGLRVTGSHERLTIELKKCVTGALQLSSTNPTLTVSDTVIDANGGVAIQMPGGSVNLDACSVLGTTQCQELTASNALFTGLVTVARLQSGCVRFCFVPDGSITPRRHRCQPDLALSDAKPGDVASIVLSLVPSFVADSYGSPSYLQLSDFCPIEIRKGADDGAEMGAWHFLRQAQREANLLASLDEYLRLGLEAGLIHAT